MLTTTLYGIAVSHELPTYVKTAAVDELLAEGLHPQAYADLAERQYPIHTKAACVFSAAQISSLPESPRRQRCVDRVKAAAVSLGVLPDVESVLHPVPPTHAPELFAWRDENGNALPIKTAMDMQQSTDWLLENRPKMSLERCRLIADNILKRADETGTQLRGAADLYRICGQAVPDVAAIKAACEWRARTLKQTEPDVSDKLLELAGRADSLHGDCKQAAVVVNVLDDVDATYDLRRLYAEGMPRPEDGFGATRADLQVLKESMVVTASGDVFDKTAFTRISTTQVAGWMGEGFLTKAAEAGSLCVDRLAAAVEGLNRAEANRFAKMAATAGVTPIGRVAPSQPLVA